MKVTGLSADSVAPLMDSPKSNVSLQLQPPPINGLEVIDRVDFFFFASYIPVVVGRV